MRGKFENIISLDVVTPSKIKHICKCGNKDIDIMSVCEITKVFKDKHIPMVEITCICSACGATKVEEAYLYKE